MRLTLRTLLAYLDDVLKPEEQEELKHRIEQSEFASTLVQRIRHTLRRIRLSAPKIDARGLGSDANSVTEYLDNTMPADHNVEFEKVCLESDVHLAEVAACHQILAKVLSEPAHVPDEMRDRIYALKERLAHSAAAAVPSSNGKEAAEPAPPPVSATPEPPPPPVERPKRQVPEYLRPEPKSGAWYLLPVGLLALLALAFFLPPLNQYNPLLMPSTDEVAQNAQPIDADDKDRPQPADSLTPEEATPADTQPELPAETKETDAVIDARPPMPEESETPAEETAVAKADAAVTKSDVVPDSTEPPPPPRPVDDSSDKPRVEPAVPVSSGDELGRYSSDETVLATYDAKERIWMRVPPRSLIVDGQRCISLPVYRPQIALASGVQITLIGETSVAFKRDPASELPLLSVDTGRLLLQSIALPNVTMALNLGGIPGTLTLETPDAEAAIEVVTYLPPGSDPLADEDLRGGAYTIAYIMSVNGSITWEQEGVGPVELGTNFVYTLIGGEETRRQGPVKLPGWISPANTSTLDRESAKILEPLLPVDRPLELALQEQANHRRIDVRVLVARCLAFLGNYEPLIKHLSAEEYRSYWMRPDGYVDLLRKQLAHGGAVAQRLHDGLIDARGERDGALLYRLLQGYTEAQLESRSDETLVDLLSHPNMDIRVLAIDNLQRITGTMRQYNPGNSPEKNRPRIINWQESLNKGEIRYAVKPSPLQDFQPLEDAEEK